MKLPKCEHAANDLLPWYVRGTLSPDEERLVRSHLDGCDVCSEELEELRGFADAVLRDSDAPGPE